MHRFWLAATLGFLATPALATLDKLTVTLKQLDSFQSGIFAAGGAEIVAFDASTKRIFVVNASAVTVDVLDARRPDQLDKIASIDASSLGGSANSIAVRDGVLAVAVEANDRQANGVVAFFRSADLKLLNTVMVGALPDMVAFDESGDFVLVANEGEPNDDYNIDPVGSISVIDLRRGVRRARVRNATFEAFNSQIDALRAAGVRIYGPSATVAQDLEPEYITTEGRFAYVTLQEANAIAVVDILRAQVTDIRPLGFKDHSLPGNQFDASDRDNGINIASWPVQGIFSPDAIEAYKFRGQTFLVTANEGDTRAISGFNEEVRVGANAVRLDPTAFPNAAALKNNAALGRLTITNTLGDTDGDGDFDALFVPGARSFSIWTTRGERVFDSGSDFESITANLLPAAFNSNHDEQPSRDSRSDNKGPEPEGLVLGEHLGRTFAFIGLERIGGIMVYDITNPREVEFVEYVNNRNFDVPVCLTDAGGECVASNPAAGDLGPEGLTFVPWFRSPTLRPLLIVGNEISGSTTVYELQLVRR
jgi:hypothetical protein